jgi:NAD(P)H dehydrogenase (quinone)
VTSRLRADRGLPLETASEKETDMTRIAVIYYSATGNVHVLAEAVAEGAAQAGADVRVRRVAELAPAEAIDANPAWRAHADATADTEVATNDDVRWADGLAFGSPTRFGNVSAQLKQFLDSTGPLWAAGELANKVATGFTSASNRHGGNESTLLALYNTLHHWGAILVAPGYTDQSVTQAGGNPYGTAHASAGGPPGDDVLAAARYQGRRLAAITASIVGGQRDERLAA